MICFQVQMVWRKRLQNDMSENAGFTETWLEDDLDNGLIPYFRHAV